jgi:hypothetical protein
VAKVVPGLSSCPLQYKDTTALFKQQGGNQSGLLPDGLHDIWVDRPCWNGPSESLTTPINAPTQTRTVFISMRRQVDRVGCSLLAHRGALMEVSPAALEYVSRLWRRKNVARSYTPRIYIINTRIAGSQPSPSRLSQFACQSYLSPYSQVLNCSPNLAHIRLLLYFCNSPGLKKDCVDIQKEKGSYVLIIPHDDQMHYIAEMPWKNSLIVECLRRCNRVPPDPSRDPSGNTPVSKVGTINKII